MSDFRRAEIIEALCRMTANSNQSRDYQLGHALAMFLEIKGGQPTPAEIDAAIAWIRRWNEGEGMDALVLRKLDQIIAAVGKEGP